MKTIDCLVLILGGGKGTRLFPLTLERSKPAVGFAGKYRLIDIPISNCINSGYNKIFIITQFLSASLHGHIMRTYRFDNFSQGFVEILSAEQSHEDTRWFQGAADAVRQVLRHLRYMGEENVLILSGDQLYKMDYRHMFNFHTKKNADVTVASIFVDASDATRLGILDCSASGCLKNIIEKPHSLKGLKIGARKVWEQGTWSKKYLASMGIYLFKKSLLFDILNQTKTADFGRNILPFLIKKKYKVYAYPSHDYWLDIGTIKSYYEANMDLLSAKPKFNLFDEKWPLFSRARFLPPSNFIDSKLLNILVADGCRIKKSTIVNSIVGLRSRIKENSQVRDSIIMGNDYYEQNINGEICRPQFGRGVVIEKAIIDKNVTIGDFCRIRDKSSAADYEGKDYYIRDGITIVKRGVTLAPHTII
ncbi:MAG: glucose-1-phosphate adenylyltransferase [Candidatus Omnitrophota bacterium]